MHFFLLRFFVSASSSTFCVPSFSSEALGFSVGDFRVLTVTAFAVFNPTFPVYTRYVRFSCFLLVVFVLWFVVGLLGKLLCDWVLILVSRPFSGGF